MAQCRRGEAACGRIETILVFVPGAERTDANERTSPIQARRWLRCAGGRFKQIFSRSLRGVWLSSQTGEDTTADKRSYLEPLRARR
jgi:hypothetical protein